MPVTGHTDHYNGHDEGSEQLAGATEETLRCYTNTCSSWA